MEYLQPLFDRVLVKVIELKDVKKGDLYIPESAVEKPIEGIVVAVGKGRINEKGERVPMDVKPLDHVLFPKYSGTETEVNEEKHLMLNETEILGCFFTT